MSGMVVVDAASLLVKIAAIKAALTPKQISAASAAILREDIRRLFTDGGEPAGSWAPTIAKYRQRGQKRKISGTVRPLWHRGVLRKSITVAKEGNTSWVQTNQIKAPTLHYGAKQGQFLATSRRLVPWGDIPARPFMIVPSGTPEKVEEALKIRAEGAIKR
jgi:phage gpG-like protein